MRALRLCRLPSICGGDRGRRRRNRSLPAGRRCDDRATCATSAMRRTAARHVARTARAAARRPHRRGGVHRLHAVHPGVSGGRDRRRAKAHARRAVDPVQRLRAVRGILPRRLHRDDPRGPRMVRGRRHRRARAIPPGGAGSRTQPLPSVCTKPASGRRPSPPRSRVRERAAQRWCRRCNPRCRRCNPRPDSYTSDTRGYTSDTGLAVRHTTNAQTRQQLRPSA